MLYLIAAGLRCSMCAGLHPRAASRRWPGIILFVQTFGDLVNFNPHIHVLAADGAFDVDGGFRVLPPTTPPRCWSGPGSASTCYRVSQVHDLIDAARIPRTIRD
jgi:hypothetical protein